MQAIKNTRAIFLSFFLLVSFFSFVLINKIQAAPSCTAIATGDWEDPLIWNNCNGVDGIPASSDTVSISTDSIVTINTDVTANALFIYDPVNAARGFTLVSPGSLTTTDYITLTAPSGIGSSTLDIGDGTTVNVGGGFIHSGGTLTMSGTSTVNFNGSDAQTMGASSTYNNVVIANTSGGVALNGGVTINGNLDINEGVLETGEYTLTVVGDTTVVDGGTLNLGSDTFSLGLLDATAVGSTVNYTRAGVQTVIDTNYYDLGLQGSGTKTFSGSLAVDNILSIDSGVIVDLVLTSPTTGGLYFDGALQAAGTWGPTGSGADFENDTYFTGSGGILTNAGTATISFSGDGTGTEGDEYIITTCEQLIEVNNFLDAYFQLYDDLDCTPNGNDIMIGSDSEPFTGNFYGAGYIVNVEIETGEDYVGLFRYIDGGTITEMGVSGTVDGGSYAGGLIGYANNPDIDESFSEVIVASGGEYVGGFAGYLNGGLTTNSYAIGDVHGGTENTGGFVGEVDGEAVITYSYATGAVSTNSIEGIDIGGFAGDIDNSTVAFSYATGDVSGVSYVGGFVGDSDRSATIMYSYSLGRVEGTGEKTGGFIGDAVDGVFISNSYSLSEVTGVHEVGGFVGNIEDSTLTHVYSAGSSVSGDTRVGGFVGDDDGGNTFTMDFFDTETSGFENACGEGDCVNVVGETTANMKDADTFNSYSEDEYNFSLADTATYRYIKWEITKVRDGSDTDCYTGDVCTQASEFLPTFDGFSSLTFIDDATTTNPDGINPGEQQPGKLFDSETSTTFLDAAFSESNSSDGSTVVIFDVFDGNEVEFNGYNWATGGDMPTRDPLSWTVSGSADGLSYDLLDTQTDYYPTTDRQSWLFTRNENWDFYQVWGIDEDAINNVGYPFFQWQGFEYEYSAPEEAVPYIITEVTPISGNITDRSPVYHFAIEGEGEAELLVSEGCGENILATALGSFPDDQQIEFSGLEVGQTYECTVSVNSDAGLSNELTVGPFTVISSGGSTSGTTRSARINNLRAQGKEVEAQKLEQPALVVIPPLTRLLKYKMIGEDVRTMQQLLNKKGYTLALTGPGSPGSETPYYGPKTLAMIKKFQLANGLIPDGIVGPLTWGMLNK
jgi:hypothetical protein